MDFDERQLKMLNGLSWPMIFLIVIGIILVFSGLSNLSDFFHLSRKGAIVEGEVQSSKLVTRHSDKGDLIQHYYELLVRFHKGNKILPAEVQSISEYRKGDKIKMVQKDTVHYVPYENNGRNPLTGLFLAIAGAGVVAGPFLSVRISDTAASYDTAAVLILIGFAAFFGYRAERADGLEKVDGKVSDLLLYQTDRERRQIISPKTWYPIIEYTVGDDTRHFRSSVSSSYKSSFKIGQKVSLYRNPETGEVFEKKPSNTMLIVAIAFWAFGIYGLIGTIAM